MKVNYDELLVKSYKYWDIYLHENQCYLGRIFLLLRNQEGFEDFMSIDGEIREEFFRVGEEIKKALKKLFKPDKMNYAALSNTSEKLHVHIIPRYKTERVFDGKNYVDARWGKNYAPYDKDYPVDISMLHKLRDTIQKELTQCG